MLLSRRFEAPSRITRPAIFAVEVAPISIFSAVVPVNVNELSAGMLRSVPVAPLRVSVLPNAPAARLGVAPFVRRNAATVSVDTFVIVGEGVVVPSMIRTSATFGTVRTGVQLAATPQSLLKEPVQV